MAICPSTLRVGRLQTAGANSPEAMASIGRLVRRAAVLQRRERRRGRRIQPRFRLSQIGVTSLGRADSKSVPGSLAGAISMS